MQFVSYAYAGIMGRSIFNGGLVDFHLEQFGLTEIPGVGSADPYFKLCAAYSPTAGFLPI